MMGLYLGGGGEGSLIERFHSSGQRLCKFIGKKKAFTWEKISTPRCFFWYTNIAPVSLFWNTKMAAMKSCENALYVGEVINSSLQYLNK